MNEVERWTVFVCTGCGQATGRHKDCDAKREAVEVVPAEKFELLRAIAQEAVDALGGEEAITESQFGVGNPAENYYEVSEELEGRLKALLAA